MKPKGLQSDSRHEDGFLLLGVLFMILVIMLMLAIAAPKVADSIRRDKEEETIHRGKQYARAIQMYYNKYNRYPNTIDQLMKDNNQRFLRKRYLDPMTGKDDWRIIHNGEQKVPTMGLFGQAGPQNGITPTGASTGIGTGAAGSSPSSPFASSGASGSSLGSGGSSLGSSSGSGFGSSGSGFGSSGSSFGSGSSTSPFSSNSGSGLGNSGSSTSPIGGTDSSSGSGFGSSAGIGGTATTGASGTTSANNIGGVQTTGGNNGGFGSPGATLGGAPIVGVGLLDKKTSIKVYRKQTHYNQWEFVFDPNQSIMEAAGGAGVNGGKLLMVSVLMVSVLMVIMVVA